MRPIFCCFLLGFGCGPAESDQTGTTEDSTTWWSTTPSSGTDVGSDTTDSKETTGSGGEFKGGWSMLIDLETDSGELYYSHVAESSGTCELLGLVAVTGEPDGCTDCDFAHTLAVSSVSIVEDGGGCDDADEVTALEGSELGFGQGEPFLTTYDGIDYYSLYERTTGDSWSLLGSGYSAILEDGKGWYFGYKP